MKPYALSLFIFRRDLRIPDNTALVAALQASRKVIAAFIVDPRQVSENSYKSDHAVQFMTKSLLELERALKERGGRLYVFTGQAQDVVGQILNELKIEAVFFNRDYTPFSVKRDLAIQGICEARGVDCQMFDDALLNPPGSVLKASGGPYTVFTPFFRKASGIGVPGPQGLAQGDFFTGAVSLEASSGLARILGPFRETPVVQGGRGSALRIINNINSLRNYAVTRDLPAELGTSRLSAHLKFGTVSVREVYHGIRKVLGTDHPLIRQLYWRDFFTHIAYHFPHVFGNAFYEEYNGIPWRDDERLFKAWCLGKTGFPIVDAGMRELNATGFMHNRSRMIAASFLVKDLHIDWRRGERYFAQKLVDYDPAVNNGNWQWAASTGCDHQPYFRIFNPWLQQKRFDPEGVYIKVWVPELSGCTAREILSVGEGKRAAAGYPSQVISHSDAAIWVREVYREASRRGKKY